jgi:hypothetical protein
MATFEESLSESLKSAASATLVRPELEEMVESRLRTPTKRSQPRAISAVAAAVLLVIGTAVLVDQAASQHGGTLSPAGGGWSGRIGPLVGGWGGLPDAPIPARSEYEAVWTGSEMIVWGGYDSSGNLADGAAYDPATHRWTTLPPAPLAPRAGPVGVWTGKEMLVFGGSSDSSFSDGAAYDPAGNSWRSLAPIPSSLGGNLTATGSYAVWTGSRMVVWGFFGNSRQGAHGGSLDAATFDPTSNTWTIGTRAPVEAPLGGDAFWTGKEMLVWGVASYPATVEQADSTGGGNVAARPAGSQDVGVAYNPATQTWSLLPKAPLEQTGAGSMLAAWTGRELVVGGGDLRHGYAKDAAAYNPSTGEWHRLPDAPVGFTGNDNYPDVWTGTSVISFEDGVAGGRPLLLDPLSGRWHLGAPAPIPGRLEAEETWAGTQALVWGGGRAENSANYGSCCFALTKGFSYTP